MKTTAQLTLTKLPTGQPTRAHLVVTLTAPPVAKTSKRPPVCVVPVIDVSGSMQGAKLEQAKRSVLRLIDHLGPDDWCGVGAFASQVYLVGKPEPMTVEAKARLKIAVGDLEPMDQTNLSGGMVKGFELANEARLPENALARVILFTDGGANAGVATTAPDLTALVTKLRGRATLSAFGYGEDADQDLLSELARAGGGNYAFVSGPDAAVSAFARELGGLLSTYAQEIEVSVTAADGARVLSVLSDVDADTVRGVTRLQLPDILGEEERHLVLEVELPTVDAPACGEPFAVEGKYRVLGDGAALETRTFRDLVTVEWVEPARAQRQPTPALDVIVAQAQLLRAQLDAEEAARRSDFQLAVQVLVVLGKDLTLRGHTAAAKTCHEMAERVRDGSAYQRSSAYRKSMQSGLRRGSSTSLDSAAMADLRAMGKGVRTRAQDEMADSFEKGEPTAPRPKRSPSEPGAPQGGVRQRRSKRW
jgi:Ca-activated chloride channel family protein